MHARSIAVVLCGCGRADGSEIHESVSLLIHLDRHGFNYRCFAPDLLQPEVVDHLHNKVVHEQRNMLVEAARIARGEIAPLAQLDPHKFDAITFPGGNGLAKNLCTFARHGADCTVNADVARLIRAFHDARKPIGLICIAPVLAARVLGTAAGGPGCTITLGPGGEAASAAARMGAQTVAKGVTEAFTDQTQKIVTTPAYMCETGPAGVFAGVGAMVDELARLL
ncbi:MAG: isoprenoid biosynthesis glyoxalase ElbB [Phycisphaerales bacterium]